MMHCNFPKQKVTYEDDVIWDSLLKKRRMNSFEVYMKFKYVFKAPQ